MTGLTQNALNQALKNSDWILQLAEGARHGSFLSGPDLIKRAAHDADLEVTWTLCPELDKKSLMTMERAVRAAVDPQNGLWSNDDQFIYDVNIVPSFEDALIAVLLNPRDSGLRPSPGFCRSVASAPRT
jgi:hypothetical protein